MAFQLLRTVFDNSFEQGIDKEKKSVVAIVYCNTDLSSFSFGGVHFLLLAEVTTIIK